MAVSSYGPHFGEERPLVGSHGSGAIFFAHCNLRCRFCQNYVISQLGEGRPAKVEELAMVMLSLQRMGCHNINLVSPTHVVPQILEALEIAVARGLSVPLVYNTGGYDAQEVLELLDEVIDIYMPDAKYSDERVARRLSGVVDYPVVNRVALKEMHRQVGNLVVDKCGVAVRGLLVRHLVLPNELAGTEEVARFLAEEISTETYLNVMTQYRPCYKAYQSNGLDRLLLRQEYTKALDIVRRHGLWRLDKVGCV